MTGAALRPLDQLAAGVDAWLAAGHQPPGIGHGSGGAGAAVPPRVTALTRPAGGRSNETLVVRAGGAGMAGSLGHLAFVVRLPPLVPWVPSCELAAQAQVQRFLAHRGVPAAAPVILEEDPQWLGTPFLVMPWVQGRALGEIPVLDPWLAGLAPSEQEAVHQRFVALVAGVHRLAWEDTALEGALRGAGSGLGQELGWWEGYVREALGDSPPGALAAGLAWLRRHLPDHQPPASLLWGDARLGNVMVDHAGQVVAALDWELASIGPAEMDLAWYLVLGQVAETVVPRRLPGFPDPAETRRRYQDSLGRPLADMEWHEVFALVRALSLSEHQARLAGREPRPPKAAADPLVAALEVRIGARRPGT